MSEAAILPTDLRPRCMDCDAPVDVLEQSATSGGTSTNRPCGCWGASLDFRHLGPNNGSPSPSSPSETDHGGDA